MSAYDKLGQYHRVEFRRKLRLAVKAYASFIDMQADLRQITGDYLPGLERAIRQAALRGDTFQAEDAPNKLLNKLMKGVRK